MQSRLVRYGKILGALWLFLNPTAAAATSTRSQRTMMLGSTELDMTAIESYSLYNGTMTSRGAVLYSATNPVNYDKMWLNAAADNRVDLLQFLFQNQNILNFNIHQKAILEDFPEQLDAFSIACLLGRVDVIRFFHERNLLLGEQGFIARQTDRVRNSGIFTAIVMGKVEVLKLLRQYGVDLSLDDYMFNLGRKSIGEYGPAWREKALHTLLDVGANPNMRVKVIKKGGNSHINLLTDLISYSDLEENESLELIKIILDHPATNMYEENGVPSCALEHAIAEGRINVAREFCKRNYNIHYLNSEGNTIYTYLAQALKIKKSERLRKNLAELRKVDECRPLIQAIDRISIPFNAPDASLRQPTINDQSNGSWSPLWILFAVGVPVLFYLFLNRSRTVENKAKPSEAIEDRNVSRFEKVQKKENSETKHKKNSKPAQGTPTTETSSTKASTSTGTSNATSSSSSKAPSSTAATISYQQEEQQEEIQKIVKTPKKTRKQKTEEALRNRDARKAARKETKDQEIRPLTKEEKEERARVFLENRHKEMELKRKRDEEVKQKLLEKELLCKKADAILHERKKVSGRDAAKDSKYPLLKEVDRHANFLTTFDIPQENQVVYILAFIFHLHRYNLLRRQLLNDAKETIVSSNLRTMIMHAPELLANHEIMVDTIKPTIASLKKIVSEDMERIHKKSSYVSQAKTSKSVTFESLSETPFYLLFEKQFEGVTSCVFENPIAPLILIKNSLATISGILAQDNPKSAQSYRLNSCALNILLTICGECLRSLQDIDLEPELKTFLVASKKIRNDSAHHDYKIQHAHLRDIVRNPRKLSEQVVRLIEKQERDQAKGNATKALTSARAVMFLPKAAHSAPAAAPAKKSGAPTPSATT